MSKIKKLINNELKEQKGVIRHGWLNDKIIREIKMATSIHEHIQVVRYSYNEDMEKCVWEDVEGMGYGWLWLNHEEKDWHKMLSKVIDTKCRYFERYMDKVYYIITENKGVKDYTLMLIDIEDKYRLDVTITFSNEELYY